jgi:radical SAM protein with 4Fe4S-binding SPASM domain
MNSMTAPTTVPQNRAPTFPRNAPPAYHVLIKPTGAICNLDCKYCFFLSKEMLYPGSRFQMAEDLLTIYLEQLLGSHRAPQVDVAWQGGEPTLMGLDFFKRSVELVNRLKRPGQTIQYKLGNIRETHLIQLLASPQQTKFGQDKKAALPRYCRECDVRFACHGECPKNRFVQTPDGEDGLNYLCAAYKAFFHHIDCSMKVMTRLVRAGRFADEIMQMSMAEKATVARAEVQGSQYAQR